MIHLFGFFLRLQYDDGMLWINLPVTVALLRRQSPQQDQPIRARGVLYQVVGEGSQVQD